MHKLDVLQPGKGPFWYYVESQVHAHMLAPHCTGAVVELKSQPVPSGGGRNSGRAEPHASAYMVVVAGRGWIIPNGGWMLAAGRHGPGVPASARGGMERIRHVS